MVELRSVNKHYNLFSHSIDGLPWYQDASIVALAKAGLAIEHELILDLCGGTGVFTELLIQKFPKTKFIVSDFSPKMIEHAENRFQGNDMVEVLHSDWIDHDVFDYKKFDGILIKNSLHLIKDFVSRIDQLAAIGNKNCRLVIIETVSPSETALGFVREIFDLIQPASIKKNYFSIGGLKNSLEKVDRWWLHRVRYHNQMVDIPEWIKAKGLPVDRRYVVLDHILRKSYDKNIAKTMKIEKSSKGVPKKMLRRQAVYTFVKI